MHSLTCVSVVVCVARKLRPCPSYSRRRDRINLVLLNNYYKGEGICEPMAVAKRGWVMHVKMCFFHAEQRSPCDWSRLLPV